MTTDDRHPQGPQESSGVHSASAPNRLMTSTPGLAEALVADPALKAELRHVLALAAREPKRESVTWTLKLMQHPVFAAIARILESKVPPAAGFGKFGERSSKQPDLSPHR